MISFLIYAYSSFETLINQIIPKNISYEKKPNVFILKEENEKELSIKK